MSGDIASIIGKDFDGEGVEAPNTFELIPVGWYAVEIENAEVKKTKTGGGSYLKLVHSIIGEDFNGRKVFHNITLTNENPQAVEIGMRDLEAIRLACGLATISDTTDLIGKQVEARIVIKPPKGDFEADNDVKGWRAVGGKVSDKPRHASASVASKPSAKASEPEKRARKPWERD